MIDAVIDAAVLDALPLGAILLDALGMILFYNRREEQSANRQRDEVMGKNFFTEVAPCAQVREFYDQFLESVQQPGWIASFYFHFALPGRPRDVEITMASFQYREDLLCLILARDIIK